jgi:hypothetical protein
MDLVYEGRNSFACSAEESGRLDARAEDRQLFDANSLLVVICWRPPTGFAVHETNRVVFL